MELFSPCAFTRRYAPKANMLITECGVSKAYQPRDNNEDHPPVTGYKGLWDTGATNSGITRKIIEELRLLPVSFAIVNGTNGEYRTPVYLVNILLPNKVGIPFLRVTECVLQDFDVLIGMDVISHGDFCITNMNEETNFSFQIPPTHNTDYVQEINTTVHNTPVVNSVE